MSRSTIQHRGVYLLIVMLLFFGGRVSAQAGSADQNFKTIPQQIKSNAEVKATNKANTVAGSATDKVDSGVNKAFKGIGKMFRKKPKPVKDSVGTPVAPVAPVTPIVPGTPVAPVPGASATPNTDTTGSKRSGS